MRNPPFAHHFGGDIGAQIVEMRQAHAQNE